MAVATKRLSEVLEIGPLEIMPREHLARAAGHALMLSIRELRLLTELARRADRIMGREELFRLVWGREMRAGDRSVDVYVRKLRVKLDAALPGWCFIHTHFGLGYRLAAERARDATGRPDPNNSAPARPAPDNSAPGGSAPDNSAPEGSAPRSPRW